MGATYTNHIVTSPDDPVSSRIDDDRRPVIELGDLQLEWCPLKARPASRPWPEPAAP